MEIKTNTAINNISNKKSDRPKEQSEVQNQGDFAATQTQQTQSRTAEANGEETKALADRMQASREVNGGFRAYAGGHPDHSDEVDVTVVPDVEVETPPPNQHPDHPATPSPSEDSDDVAPVEDKDDSAPIQEAEEKDETSEPEDDGPVAPVDQTPETNPYKPGDIPRKEDPTEPFPPDAIPKEFVASIIDDIEGEHSPRPDGQVGKGEVRNAQGIWTRELQELDGLAKEEGFTTQEEYDEYLTERADLIDQIRAADHITTISKPSPVEKVAGLALVSN